MSLSHHAALTAALVGMFALASSPASAALIPAGSSFSFTGGAASIGSANLWDGTGIDFYSFGSPGVGVAGTPHITDPTVGAFTAFNPLNCPASAAGGCGTIEDLQTYTPSSNTLTLPTLPVFSFLTVTQSAAQSGTVALDATFTLTDFTNSEIVPSGNTLGTLILSGLGTLTFTGFDPTPAIMTITAQGNGATSYSGTVVVAAAAVPEPASMLMGVGLAGLAVIRRRSHLLTRAAMTGPIWRHDTPFHHLIDTPSFFVVDRLRLRGRSRPPAELRGFPDPLAG
jgi:hypothetical protein